MSGSALNSEIWTSGPQKNELGQVRAWTSLKFKPREIWDQPRGGNQARRSKLIARASQNHEKSEKLENWEKQPKTSGFIDFSTLKINFRSADAANHINRSGDQPPRFWFATSAERGGIIYIFYYYILIPWQSLLWNFIRHFACSASRRYISWLNENKLYESSRRKPGWRFTAGVQFVNES